MLSRRRASSSSVPYTSGNPRRGVVALPCPRRQRLRDNPRTETSIIRGSVSGTRHRRTGGAVGVPRRPTPVVPLVAKRNRISCYLPLRVSLFPLICSVVLGASSGFL